MALVTLRTNVRDHGLTVLDPQLQQRVWLVPNDGHILVGAGALDGLPVLCEFNRVTGDLTAEVWSTNSDDLWYTLRTDWLLPSVGTGPTDELVRGFFEWSQRIYPGEGGQIGELVEQVVGRGLVYCAPDAPNPFRTNQLHFNTQTNDIFERVVTW